jgi:hypothetical protein
MPLPLCQRSSGFQPLSKNASMPPNRQTQERNAPTAPPERQDAAATHFAAEIDEEAPILCQSPFAPADSTSPL